MKEYISKDYIDNILNSKMKNWFGPEYYACSIIKDEIDAAPETEVLIVGLDLAEDTDGRN